MNIETRYKDLFLIVRQILFLDDNVHKGIMTNQKMRWWDQDVINYPE